jgi:hypothetical protein
LCKLFGISSHWIMLVTWMCLAPSSLPVRWQILPSQLEGSQGAPPSCTLLAQPRAEDAHQAEGVDYSVPPAGARPPPRLVVLL